ncbi:MAG TPA: hypothetical protein VJT31_29365 [Rugosimonospora sp.]|nr:hypothetical protein [Rugosimonospora sp.]
MTSNPSGTAVRSVSRSRPDSRLWTEPSCVDGHRPAVRDAVVVAVILGVALVVTGGLWPHPATAALAVNPGDQALDEWFLAHATRVYTGHVELVTGMLNAPDGVNLMCNASLLGLGVLLAPVTLAFGAPVSFAVIVTGNVAATGAGWYLLLARSLRYHRAAAALGGMLTAFAPGMMSHANSHLHITAQWLWPPLVWCLLRLARIHRTTHRRWRRAAGYGALAGVLVWLQVFLGEEVLLLGAFAVVLFCLAYAAVAVRRVGALLPHLAVGLAAAVLVGGVLSAVPLWVQFAGPQHVPNGVFTAPFFSADLAAYTARSPLALFADPSAARLVTHVGEASSFFGTPLLLTAAATTVWLWRRPEILAAAVTTVAMGALALGPHLIINTRHTTIAGPFTLLDGLPLIQDALPVRFALAATAPLALILTAAVHTALTRPTAVRIAVPVAVLAALLPVLPAPLPVTPRTPVPVFFTRGFWRDCVPEGGVLVPVPLPDGANTDPMRWPAATGDRFAIPQGWFIGPYGPGGTATIGTYPRPTAQLLSTVAATGEVPDITPGQRAAARQDITFWHASCIVLADATPHRAALKSTLDTLLGPGRHLADVWTWQPGASHGRGRGSRL